MSAIKTFFIVCAIATAGCNQNSQPKIKAVGEPSALSDTLTQDQIIKLLSDAVTDLNKKNFGNAIELTIRITKADPVNFDAYVIGSEAEAMSGDMKAALDKLEIAFRKGFKDTDRLTKEHRFVAVRATPEFNYLLRKYGLSQPEKTGESEIKTGDVSIKEDGNSQEIKAGGITIHIPKD